jgi:hypothetical protein
MSRCTHDVRFALPVFPSGQRVVNTTPSCVYPSNNPLSTHLAHSNTIQRQALSASADPSGTAVMEAAPKMAHPPGGHR